MQGPFYDALETRSPEEREAALMAQLPQVIAAAKEHAPAYRRLLAKALFPSWDDALLFRKLATLRGDVPVFNSVEDLRV